LIKSNDFNRNGGLRRLTPVYRIPSSICGIELAFAGRFMQPKIM